MIDPRELRIGNLVMPKHNTIASTVDAIDNDDIRLICEYQEAVGSVTIICGPDDLIPIPITPEWCDKMSKANPIFSRMPNFPHIEYVHQAQNLFYAMTGEELAIK